jgi:hypothetical protein
VPARDAGEGRGRDAGLVREVLLTEAVLAAYLTNRGREFYEQGFDLRLWPELLDFRVTAAVTSDKERHFAM